MQTLLTLSNTWESVGNADSQIAPLSIELLTKCLGDMPRLIQIREAQASTSGPGPEMLLVQSRPMWSQCWSTDHIASSVHGRPLAGASALLLGSSVFPFTPLPSVSPRPYFYWILLSPASQSSRTTSGKQFGCSSKLNLELSHEPASPLLGIPQRTEKQGPRLLSTYVYCNPVHNSQMVEMT